MKKMFNNKSSGKYYKAAYEEFWGLHSEVEKKRILSRLKVAKKKTLTPIELGNLKRLLQELQVDDWTSEIDNDLTYGENKSEITKKYGQLPDKNREELAVIEEAAGESFIDYMSNLVKDIRGGNTEAKNYMRDLGYKTLYGFLRALKGYIPDYLLEEWMVPKVVRIREFVEQRIETEEDAKHVLEGVAEISELLATMPKTIRNKYEPEIAELKTKAQAKVIKEEPTEEEMTLDEITLKRGKEKILDWLHTEEQRENTCDFDIETFVKLVAAHATFTPAFFRRVIDELKADGLLYSPREGVIRRTECKEPKPPEAREEEALAKESPEAREAEASRILEQAKKGEEETHTLEQIKAFIAHTKLDTIEAAHSFLEGVSKLYPLLIRVPNEQADAYRQKLVDIAVKAHEITMAPPSKPVLKEEEAIPEPAFEILLETLECKDTLYSLYAQREKLPWADMSKEQVLKVGKAVEARKAEIISGHTKP